MAADLPNERRIEILETAAKLICEKGYSGTSIQDISGALNLTKAGLYHHIRSKEHLLLEIMHYGMDQFEDRVLSQVMPIRDPVERLKVCMEKNILLVTSGWSTAVTIILHEHNTLTGEFGAQINARKKRYVRFLEESFSEAMRKKRIRRVNPKVAAFSFLGMVLWIYKWFRHDGSLTEKKLADEMIDLLFGGLETTRAKPKATKKKVSKTRPTRASQKRTKSARGGVDSPRRRR
jgi:AcrR family transcriptional regulator